METKAYTTKLFQEWMINPPTKAIRFSVAETLVRAARLFHDPYEFEWSMIRNSPEFDGFVSASHTRVLLIVGDEELERPDILVLHAWDDRLGPSEELKLFKKTGYDGFLADMIPMSLPSYYLS